MNILLDKWKKFAEGKRRSSLLLLFCVYIPTAALWGYLTFVFSPMYISESRFALRTSDSSDLPTLAGMFFQNTSGISIDAHIVQNYVTSMDMLEKVGKEIDLQKHYGNRDRDVVSRLKRSPTKEELFDYWQRVVSASFNQDKGIITVEVKAYSPEMAKGINDVVLTVSEELVNRMNARAHQDALQLTREEVEASERRVLRAQAALRQFRDDKSILDPEATAKGLEGVIAKLESEAAATQAELTAALQVMQPNSPRVQTLDTRLNALKEQLNKERTRLAGLDSEDATLSSLVGDYAQLAAEEEFAQKQLVQSMAAFEAARLKAISQSRYLVPFQPPTLPEESLFPRPILFTAVGFLALLILLGLCSLTVAAIKDHMGV